MIGTSPTCNRAPQSCSTCDSLRLLPRLLQIRLDEFDAHATIVASADARAAAAMHEVVQSMRGLVALLGDSKGPEVAGESSLSRIAFLRERLDRTDPADRENDNTLGALADLIRSGCGLNGSRIHSDAHQNRPEQNRTETN